ncbi:hypothetical protein niasHS_004394 [Heterodera schachtii]|uniref:Uncharacterized protein n=1 Tax=Heterodera schachtii TaxID=97005 RepID=A0ABD2K190_HETSC
MAFSLKGCRWHFGTTPRGALHTKHTSHIAAPCHLSVPAVKCHHIIFRKIVVPKMRSGRTGGIHFISRNNPCRGRQRVKMPMPMMANSENGLIGVVPVPRRCRRCQFDGVP